MIKDYKIITLCGSTRFKEQFDLPENEEPAVIIPLGYAADELKPKSRKAIDEITEQRGQSDARINHAES